MKNMIRLLPVLACLALGAAPVAMAAQSQLVPFDARLAVISSHVQHSNVVYDGKPALRLVDAAPPGTADSARLLIMPSTQFTDGVIELDMAGDLMPGAAQGARGFVGIAFRAKPDASQYEYFYLRPTNGRSNDQLRRNHSVQYASHPNHPWQLLREKFPGRYESYADLVPARWTRVRVVVQGTTARLFVNNAEQPSLVLDDLKLGLSNGSIGLWIGPGTVAHFANLHIEHATPN
jgi:hypothetical protein